MASSLSSLLNSFIEISLFQVAVVQTEVTSNSRKSAVKWWKKEAKFYAFYDRKGFVIELPRPKLVKMHIFAKELQCL